MTIQSFVIKTNDGAQYLTRNWSMRTDQSGTLELRGDFVLYEGLKTSTWVSTLNGAGGIFFIAANEQQVALLVKAEDTRRVEKLAAHLIGLTENLVDRHLPEEFKRILERTPEVLDTLGSLMTDGIKNALDKMGKGK